MGSDYETYIYQQSLIVSTLLDEIAETWSDQITLRIRYEYYLKPVCDNAQLHIAKFNYTLGGYDGVQYQPWTQKVLWQTKSGCQDPTAAMIARLGVFIDEVTEDPAKKKQRLEAEAREKELAEMEPWLRHLEENPNLKVWAEANPDAAAKARQKFLEKLDQERSGQLDKIEYIPGQMYPGYD